MATDDMLGKRNFCRCQVCRNRGQINSFLVRLRNNPNREYSSVPFSFALFSLRAIASFSCDLIRVQKFEIAAGFDQVVLFSPGGPNHD